MILNSNHLSNLIFACILRENTYIQYFVYSEMSSCSDDCNDQLETQYFQALLLALREVGLNNEMIQHIFFCPVEINFN